MCRDHEHGQRRCSCCDPEARRAARREKKMRERGHEGEIDQDFASLTVAGRAERADLCPESVYDPSPTVRAGAARGPLSEEAEDALAQDESPRVRAMLARNRRTTPGALEALAADEDRAVREAVAAHPHTSPATLAAMAASLNRRRDLGVAQRLARNPRTPSDALQDWLETGTGGWRTLAKATLRARAEAAADAFLTGTERIGVGIEEAADGSGGVLDDPLGTRGAKVG